MAISLERRIAVVFGVANKRSIAWGIAQKLQQAGAQLAITYQNERLAQEARDLISDLPNAQAFQCDVSNDSEIDQLFSQLRERYGSPHGRVPGVSYPRVKDWPGPFLDPAREGSRTAHEVSFFP